MSPQAKDLQRRAMDVALEKFPNGDEVTLLNYANALLASLAAQAIEIAGRGGDGYACH